MKKHIQPICLLFTLFLFSNQSFSQANFQPATIKDITGELFKGWIDYKQWDMNPKTIRFREKADGEIISLSVKEVLAFEITGEEKYLKAIVVKDMRPITISELKVNQGDIFVKDTVFLRELFESDEVNLYALNDGKTHFFTKGKNTDFEELIYKIDYLSDEKGLRTETRNIFRNQLMKYIISNSDYKTLERKLQTINYEEDELINFFATLKKKPTNTVHRNKPVFFISGGTVLSKLKVSGQTNIADHRFTLAPAPEIGVGIDFLSKRNFGDFIIRFEVQFYTIHYKGTYIRANYYSQKVDEKYSLKMNSISPSASVLYNFIRGNSFRMYAGVKSALTFSSYPENKFTEHNLSTGERSATNNYIKYENTWMNAEFQTGVILNKRIGINASVKFLGSLTDLIKIPVVIKSYSLVASYRF